MKAYLRPFLGAMLAALLTSCYGPGMVYPDGGYAAGTYTTYDTYGYAPVGVYGNPGWGGGWGRGWGWGGAGWAASRYSCSRCGYNPCRCGGGHRDSHDHGSHARSGGNSSDRKYRIIAGDLDGKKKPNDFHSLDWYHDRGYSLEKAKIETDRGAVIDKRPSSQKSSSSASRGSSSSSNNRSRISSSSSSSGRPKSSSSSGSSSRSSSGNLREHIKTQLQKK